MTDRDWSCGLPQIPLADLPRPIDSPLICPCALEQWAHLPQVVIDDRLPAIEPKRPDQLTNPHPRQRWVPAQQLMDLSLNGSSFDGRSGQRNPGGASERNTERIVLRAKPVRRTNSLIETPRTKCSRRSSAHCSKSSTLLLPVSTTQSSQAHQHPGRLRQHPRGSNLNRRRGVSLPPAPTACLPLPRTPKPQQNKVVVRRAPSPTHHQTYKTNLL